MSLKTGKDIELQIIDLYINGMSSPFISKKFGICYLTVINILRRNNIRIRTRKENSRKFTVNHDYFKVINSEDKAYFLGLLIADGYNKSNGFVITLQDRDRPILEEFLKRVSYTGKLYTIKRKEASHQDYCRLDISSNKLSEDLTKLGCVPKKSHKTYFPNIPEALWNHFIRGVFDGDGHIGNSEGSTLRVELIGNITLIERIQEILILKCNLSKTKIRYSKGSSTIVSFGYHGKTNPNKIRKWLYKDATIYLERKHNKFFNKSK